MNRYGIVYYNYVECGIIKETEDGFVFTYKKEYLESSDSKPISLNIPLSEKEYFSTMLHPFFDGLIPEGWLLQIATNKWGLKRNDRMGLLLTVCEDTIGAVSVRGVIR
jgi:serine/threonine-protein kinase HipA